MGLLHTGVLWVMDTIDAVQGEAICGLMWGLSRRNTDFPLPTFHFKSLLPPYFSRHHLSLLPFLQSTFRWLCLGLVVNQFSSAGLTTMELSAAKPSQDSIATTDLPLPKSLEETHIALVDVADHLCSKYGTVGLSAGLLDNGKAAHFNIRTLKLPGANTRPASPNSIYLVTSLAKLFIAFTIAIIVNDSRYTIKFTTKVKDIFPELIFKTFLQHAGKKLTLIDLLDNHTKFANYTNL
jgi:hypothetical protein